MESTRLLLVEDEEDDAALLLSRLRQAGFELQHRTVWTRDDFLAALNRGPWDVVISDYNIPGFGGLEALQLYGERDEEAPFIVVSGAVGDERAAELMRLGARDFILKDRLDRLPPALRRELQASSDRRRGEAATEQLHQADRLAAIGQLAAGIAHEINNPLASITADAEVIGQHLDTVRETLREQSGTADQDGFDIEITDEGGPEALLDECREIQKTMTQTLRRIRSIVGDLKTFAQIDRSEVELVNVNDIVQSACSITKNTIRHHSELKIDLTEVPRITAHGRKLVQAIVNLLLNAVQALDESRADTNEITIATRALDDAVRISVTDNGCGIPVGIRKRIFDPFYSTKRADEGTGLGLPMCAEIVRLHRGSIAFESTTGAGSRFDIRIPVETGLSPGQRRRSTSVPSPRPARILIIDDDDDIRQSFRRILQPPHDVVLAAGGESAMAKLRTDSDYDVVLCDLMMPIIDGVTVYNTMKDIAPGLRERTVFTSAGPFSDRARKFLASSHKRYLNKPVDRQDLLAAIDDVLSATQPDELRARTSARKG